MLYILSLFHLDLCTILDLCNTYYVVCIKEGDKWKMPNPLLGQLEYLFMPFGLINFPDLVQALVNNLLRNMLDRLVLL